MGTDRYLSSANAPDLEEDIRLCIVSGAREMIVDCGHLDYLTGAGLRTLLAVARMMQEIGGVFSVKGLSGQPRDLFYACGMDSLIPVADAPSPSLAQAA